MDSKQEKQISPVVSPDVEAIHKSSVDEDALKLAEMGYTQDMNRNFSVWSVLGVGFSLTNSWFGISAALITGINSGGPLLIIYGIMLIALESV
jgi:choline transport protein